MDDLIKNVESRSLNFKQTGRQKDSGLSRDNSQESQNVPETAKGHQDQIPFSKGKWRKSYPYIHPV